ncbi:MAG: DUF5666 domain-containing protein [Minisyncoccota bacterium]
MKNIEKIIPSGKTRVIIGVIGALVLALLIFHAGIAVGSHRSFFGRRGMDRNFRHTFLPGGFMLPYGFIPNSHGAVGTVTAVTLPTFAVQTRDGTSKEILVATSTIIHDGNNESAAAIAAGDQIIILGEPDSQGRIDARFIRILSTSTSTTTTP